MSKLSGLVAILSADGKRVQEYRDLGPESVEVKDGVLPVVRNEVDESTGDDTVTERSETIEASRVVLSITTRDKTTQEISDEDQDRLNAALVEPGSVVRALGLLTLQEINKLRARASMPEYTMQQFTTALKAQMRDG